MIYKIMQMISELIVYGCDTFINGLKNFYMGEVGVISSILIILVSPLYSFLKEPITWGMAYKTGITSIVPNIKLMLFGLFQILVSPVAFIIRRHNIKKMQAIQKDKELAEEKERKKEERRRKKKGLPPIEFEGMNIKSTEFYSPKRGTPNVM